MAASAALEVITLSRRLLRAACIAAVFVTAGPLPATHAGSLPDASSGRDPAATRHTPGAPGATGSTRSPAPGGAESTTPRTRGTAGATTRRTPGSTETTPRQATGGANSRAQSRGTTAAAPRTPGSADGTAPQNPGTAAAASRTPDAADGAARQNPRSAAGTPQAAGTAGATTRQTPGTADATAPQAAATADATSQQNPRSAAGTPQAAGTAGATTPQNPGTQAAGRAGAAAQGLGPVNAGAPQGLGVGALLAQLQGLYRQAEEAAEAYNATEVALKAGQDEERRLGAELGKTRTALSAEKAAAGRLAREQYQGARSFFPYVRMLLTGDPQAAQDERRLIAREGARRAGVLARLTRGEHRAGDLAAAARKSLDARQSLTAQRGLHKQQADLKLKQVERMLASLSADQLARLGTREAADTATAQRELLNSGRLATTPRTPTAAGGAALTYATEQIGKPYVWGAEGPGSFDCSGLTSQAWAHAGRSIPRTSQEQWAQLPKVPLDQLRPGDLVVYFPTATHVALYVGDGKVIHAPRPGAKVKVSPLAANPLLGAVRPDPDGAPLAEYTAPPMPQAAEGDDAGYSAEEAPADDATSAR
ncbi:NlpC/P60 family protein [Streptomyces sp. NPDC050448]|uniref:NlpC/P60 family protein n=1 Tax=Streptomyces sp. NPDC050448 TaxID=3155404 RepID=UPI0034400B13